MSNNYIDCNFVLFNCINSLKYTLPLTVSKFINSAKKQAPFSNEQDDNLPKPAINNSFQSNNTQWDLDLNTYEDNSTQSYNSQLRSNTQKLSELNQVAKADQIAFNPQKASREFKRCLENMDIQKYAKDWKIRVEAMQTISKMLRMGPAVVEVCGREFKNLRPRIVDQLKDLRSRVVREACCLLVFFSIVFDLCRT